jgi:pectate lyase
MRAHMTGNVIAGKPAVIADNWSAYVGPVAGRAKVRADAPLFESFVATQTAEAAFVSILADVGANRPVQDPVDRRILADVRNRTHTFTGSRGKLPGIIDSPKDAGGWPEYKSAAPPADADHDGMPDAWETAHGLDPKNPADGAAYRPDGYTHLEHYLNELAAKRE